MRWRALVICFVLGVVACSGGDDDDVATPTTAATTTEAPATTTTVEATTTTTESPAGAGARAVVEALADDSMEGRDNQTPGSVLAQEYLIAQVSEFAEPLGADFLQPFDVGTNIVAVMRGAELPDEYVVLGAHYDHLGRDCPTAVPGDDVCNGAADNAAGVASVLEIGRRLAADGTPPRRSVVFAFWDAEEDGLLGARAYVAAPIVPLNAVVAYLNWDIQGVNLLPSLRSTTVVVGAETGGPNLVDPARAAAEASDLDPLLLSLLFGQGRSDHAVFAGAGVPSVFFTDANSSCYHTSQDDTTTLDFDKLTSEIEIGEALARHLITTDARPAYVGDAPPATYDDAASMLAVVSRSQPDIGVFPADAQARATQFLADLQAMVDAGPDAFDDAAVGVLLTGSIDLVRLLTEGTCDGFLG